MRSRSTVPNLTLDVKYWLHMKWSSISYPFRRVYWFFLRGKNGWAPNDVWDLDSYLARVISESLNYLATTTNGYPAGCEEFSTFESWTEYLLKLSKVFADAAAFDDWYLEQWIQMYHDEGLNPDTLLDSGEHEQPSKEAREKYYALVDAEEARIRVEMKRLFDHWRNLWD